ncbi:O-antigen ligase family protein [Tunturiibacter empetritectus]|uniref:O-antigen ligase family protein n=1 Tax=Tunturiibacter empetritectus TaxID=3069691 RepID=UPI003D9B0911
MSAAIVILLSFSRYLFAFYLVCTLVRAIWIKRVDLISVFSIGVILVASVLLYDSLLSRFASAETQASDDIRVEQVSYLKRVIADYPIMGTGVGSSVSTFKRSESTPYFYEAQWYAMTMQFGFIGVSWFVCNLIGMLYACLKRRNNLFFTVIFLGWFASGLTNPYISALGSAFGLCFLLFRCNQNLDIGMSRAYDLPTGNF